MVLLRVSSESNRAACTIYTGFVVEIGEKWLWVTAAHVFEQIEDDREQFPDLQFQWKPWSSPKEVFRAVPLDSLTKTGIRIESNRKTKPALRSDEPEPNIDFGFIELDSYWRAMFLEMGVKPLPESSVAYGESDLYKASSVGAQFFVAGCPSESHSYDPVRNESTIKHAVEPLSMLRRTRMNGMIGRFRRTAEPKRTKSMVGFSGGPVLAKTGDRFFLVGVQFLQEEGHKVAQVVMTRTIFCGLREAALG